MRAIIVGGDYSADYIIKTFIKNHIPFIVVNHDKEVCEYLSKRNHIDVYCNATNKAYTYKELRVDNYDLVVALDESDVKNYVTVMMLKKYFNVKKAICTVSDPDNVKLFRELGVDTPICSSHLLAQRILNDSDIETVMKTLSLENDKIVITELTLRKKYKIVGKEIKDIVFPKLANISCIYRSFQIIIPKGDTKLLTGDRLVICSESKDQEEISEFIKEEQ